MSIFRTKPLEELLREAKEDSGLERSLGWFQLLLMGIGAIIGAGIFVLTGTAAAQHAGPAVTLSFLIGALACSCAALCYAELASSIPIAGSSYTFIYTTLGEFVAWQTAGMMLLVHFLGSATVASGWSSYMVNLLADFNIFIPAILSDTTGTVITLADGSTVTTIIDLPAFLIVLMISAILVKGTESSAFFNAIMVFVKVAVLILFVGVGAFFIEPDNWMPYIPANTGQFGEFGISGIIGGASVVFLAYTGFDAVATAAQETRNPQRDLPIAIIGALLFCAFVYMLISAVLTGIVNYTELNVAQPMAIAVDKMNMPWFSNVIKIGAIAGLTTVILVMMFGGVRILFAATHDGLLPQVLAKLHKVHHTPHVLTWIVGFCIATIAATIPIDKIVKLSNFGGLVTFTMVCYVTIYMRKSHPELPRAFRCPWVPLVPVLGILLFISIISGFPTEIYEYAAIWALFMTLVYFLYSKNHSHLNK
jgi:APA family basic amino acid/polyamine antiporter